jgi:CBS domain-containing protein
MLVSEIMHSDVKTAGSSDSFADVARVMRSHGISSVVVLDGKKLEGIVTERDIVNLVAEGGDPNTTTVEHGMTRRDLVTVDPKTELSDAAEQMVSRNIRHLPIVDGGNVVGIVSIRDMTRWAAEELAGGHEMPDIAGSHAALQAASQLQRKRGA